MNGNTYFILAYVVGGLMLWGYAILLWVESRTLKKQRPADES